MYNRGSYSTHVLYVYKYRYNTCVADTCVIHMFYTCNKPKTPHMYYTVGHVLTLYKTLSVQADTHVPGLWVLFSMFRITIDWG